MKPSPPVTKMLPLPAMTTAWWRAFLDALQRFNEGLKDRTKGAIVAEGVAQQSGTRIWKVCESGGDSWSQRSMQNSRPINFRILRSNLAAARYILGNARSFITVVWAF